MMNEHQLYLTVFWVITLVAFFDTSYRRSTAFRIASLHPRVQKIRKTAVTVTAVGIIAYLLWRPYLFGISLIEYCALTAAISPWTRIIATYLLPSTWRPDWVKEFETERDDRG